MAELNEWLKVVPPLAWPVLLAFLLAGTIFYFKVEHNAYRLRSNKVLDDAKRREFKEGKATGERIGKEAGRKDGDADGYVRGVIASHIKPKDPRGHFEKRSCEWTQAIAEVNRLRKLTKCKPKKLRS